MNPDYKDGLRAYDRGELFDPAQRGQWRRGWLQAQENHAARVRAVLKGMAQECVRADHREELQLVADQPDNTLLMIMSTPPEMLEPLGFTYLAHYRK